jgi:transcriptional regulator with XRE-family HTH domain
MASKIRDQVARRFGNALRAGRDRAGLTREQLAERSTVDLQSIGRYERGERAPGLAEALLLARAVGVSLDDLG